MSAVEERVLGMRFENTQFQGGVKSTLDSLEALNKGLKLEGATKGLGDVDAAAKRLSLQNIADGVQSVADKFKMLSIVGITTLVNLTNKAVNMATNFAKGFTVAPIMDGFAEYELKMGSIQTILANTARHGTTLKTVTAKLDELNQYADKTIYNFGDMTKNIGLFTNAGIKIEDATAMIKGFSNEAAASGTNAQGAAGAAYQLSQALSAGTIRLMDWRSLTNVGMGNKNMQNGLIEIADAMGVLTKKGVKANEITKDFNGSLTKQWLTADVMQNYLKIQAGELSDAQMKSLGLSEKQIVAFKKQAQTAEDAATKVRTWTQLVGTIKESVGSSWAETFDLVIGDFDQATKLWTSVNDTLGEMIGKAGEARNKVIKEWVDLGGRDAAIKAISNAFTALMAIIKPIKDAFRQIFPPATGKQLLDITNAIKSFTEGLKIGSATADKLKRTFAGVFAIFGIAFEVIKQLAMAIAPIFTTIFEGSGGFLDFTAKIGDWLVKVHDAIKSGEGLANTLGTISWKIQLGIMWVKDLAKAFVEFIKDVKLDGVEKAFDNIGERFAPFTKLIDIMRAAWDKLISSLGRVAEVFAPLGRIFGDMFSKLGTAVSEALNNMDFNLVLDAVNTGLFAALVIAFKKFLGDFGKAGADAKPGLMDTIKGMFGGVTDSLEQMQNTLKAATLMQIAIALGVLTASVVALSMVDSGDLTKSLTAMTVMFTQLFASMALFEKIGATKGFAKMPFVTSAMIMLGIAINILASAVKKLAELDWNELARGLTGLTGIMAVLIGTMALMPNDKKMISSAIGLTIMAGAVKILATAVKDISELSWEEIARGLTGVGGILLALGIFTRLQSANAGGIAQGAGLLLLAVGIKILAGALEDFAQFSWEEIGRGLAAMGGGLALMAAALMLVPPSSILSAAAIFIVAQSLGTIGDAVKDMAKMKWGEIGRGMTVLGGALGIIALAIGLLPPTSLLSAAAIFIVASSLSMIVDALGNMGDMSWGEIAKSLVMLAGALGIIAVAVTAMVLALPGAIALTIIAGALAVLAPILIAFGEMSWEEIGKGLIMLAGAFAVIGVAGMLLTPVIPTLIGLGIAVTLLGVGMLAAGVGLLAFSVALTALSVAGAAGTAAIVGIVSALIGLIPMVMQQIGLGIIAFAQVISTAGPAITQAIVTVLNALINAIIMLTPKIINTLFVMLTLFLNKITSFVPKLVDAGMKMIKGILKGIADNIGDIVDEAARIITNFIDGIARNLPKIIESGVNLIISFIEGLTKAINENSARLGEAGGDLAVALIQGMVNGITSGAGRVVSAAANMAQSAWEAAKAKLGIHSPSKKFMELGKYVNQGFIKGLDGGREDIKNAMGRLGEMIKSGYDAANAAIDKHEERLRKLNKARKKDRDEIRKTTKALSEAKAERAKLSAAMTTHKNQLKNEQKRLLDLAASQEKVNEKLKAAQQTLADAKKTRDDYNKSISDQFGKLPDFNKDTKLVDYAADLKKKINDTKAFATALQTLRSRGLNDTMYKELLAKGTDALPFVQDIVSAGKAGVADLNRLGSQLQSASKSLGSTASKNLYQAAVDSAAGLVEGLKKQQAAIEKQMDVIAGAMVKSIKKKLGIKSPSREFAKIGTWTVQGLAEGLKKSDPVANAAEGVGKEAIFAMQKSLSGLGSVLSGDMDVNPTITPVLDLSDVEKDSKFIDRMLATKALKLSEAYSMAKRASVGYENNRDAMAEEAAASQGDNLTFIQNNHSPKALSSADIYRQTKNQLSVAKEALT